MGGSDPSMYTAPIVVPQAPQAPRVQPVAPVMNNDASRELFAQAMKLLEGANIAPPEPPKNPNTERILMALLPAFFGAGPQYTAGLAGGYMQGREQEMARREQERQVKIAQEKARAMAVQAQAENMFDTEKTRYSQDSLNYRNEQDNSRMLTNTEIVQAELNKRFGIGDQTKRDIADDKIKSTEFIAGERAKTEAQKIAERRLANDRTAWYNLVKYVNMDGSVTQGDIDILTERAKAISPDYWQYLPMPTMGNDWKAVKSAADQRLNQKKFEETQRANQAREAAAKEKAANSGRGGKGSSGAPKPLGGKLAEDDRPVSLKEARRLAAKYQIDIDALRAKQKKDGDIRKRARYEIDILGLSAKRDGYLRIVKGEVDPVNPGAPTKPSGSPVDGLNDRVEAEKRAAEESRRKAMESVADLAAGGTGAGGASTKRPFIGPMQPEGRRGNTTPAAGANTGKPFIGPVQPKKDANGMTVTENSRFKKRPQ